MPVEIKDRLGYLSRLGVTPALQEKMRMVRFFPDHPQRLLDVGCADGVVTTAIARMYLDEQPDNPPKVIGIDLDSGFLRRARLLAAGVENVEFKKRWLRDVVNDVYRGAPRFDVVSFFSSLHEFYSYGEGMPSVMKALADAHQVTILSGVIPIRDMILNQSAFESDFRVSQVLNKVSGRDFVHPQLEEFEEIWGKIRTVADMNHFLLKYFYTANWEREKQENYIPVTFEQYLEMFKLLDMQVLYQDVYLLPYLKQKWMDDFGLTEDEVEVFRSTGNLLARKTAQVTAGKTKRLKLIG